MRKKNSKIRSKKTTDILTDKIKMKTRIRPKNKPTFADNKKITWDCLKSLSRICWWKMTAVRLLVQALVMKAVS